MPGAALLISAAVAASAVAADRLLALGMAREIARRIGAASGVTSRPVVRIRGAMFLPQLAAGRYREIDISLASFTAGGLDLRGLAAQLARVRAPLAKVVTHGGAGLMAGELTATVTIPLSALADRLPAGLTARPERGELVLAGRLPMPVSGVLRIDATGQAIAITPRVLGVPSLVGFVIRLPWMPPGLMIDSVLVTDAGLLVGLRGTEVLLTRRGTGEPEPRCAR